METKIIKRDETTLKLEITIDVAGSMLQVEESILAALNEAGAVATGEVLQRFDADGDPIMVGDVKWYSKGRQMKTYQTPYEDIRVSRHVYQRAGGGSTFCPMEQQARIIGTATPRFAKIVSNKLARCGAAEVVDDLAQNHGRVCVKATLQDVGTYVGSVLEAKEESWRYATPKFDEEVATVGIGVDGTCMMMCGEGSWREAMSGSLALYDKNGERLHTVYVGAAPEHGKGKFFHRMEQEIAHVKALYPEAGMIGIADGAKTNWDFLEPHVSEQILDFYHVTEYLAQAADVLFGARQRQRQEWLDGHCSALKHAPDAAKEIVKELASIDTEKWSSSKKEQFAEVVRYFRNHQHQMHYSRYMEKCWPIGSGVTEAACKTLIKQRLCRSGMRWKQKGAQIILSLRALVLTKTRWEQFWEKIDQYGVPKIAR